jgi:hypothetical protein
MFSKVGRRVITGLFTVALVPLLSAGQAQAQFGGRRSPPPSMPSRPLVVRGTITAVNASGTPATLTITPPRGAAVTVNVTASTKVLRNRRPAMPADLQVNDKALATYDASNNALAVVAESTRSVVRGTITAVNAGATPATLTITPPRGAAVTVNVTASTKVLRNRRPATPADLQVNDKALATYDASNNALAVVAGGS